MVADYRIRTTLGMYNGLFDSGVSLARTHWLYCPQTVAQNSALLAHSIRNTHCSWRVRI